MHTTFVEATSTAGNHGKFMLAQFDAPECARPSHVEQRFTLLSVCGWGDARDYLVVFDLQTGEGAIFRPGGSPRADLEKHAVWVCPLFEPFLEWLYAQDRTRPDWIIRLPRLVDLGDVPLSLAGHRRHGPAQAALDAIEDSTHPATVTLPKDLVRSLAGGNL